MPRTLASVTVLLAISGCATVDERRAAVPAAVTVALLPVRNAVAHGEAVLVQDALGVRVTARLAGLRPRWSYTFFLAERGDCGGSEAGGARTVPIAGALRTLGAELPRLVSDADGKADIAVTVAGRLSGSAGDFAGRSLVLQPDGYGRAACGAIPPA